MESNIKDSPVVKEFVRWVKNSNMEPIEQFYRMLGFGEIEYLLHIYGKASSKERDYMRFYLHREVFTRRLISSRDILYEQCKEHFTPEEFAEYSKFVDKIETAMRLKNGR